MLRILILTNIRSAEYPTDLVARVGTVPDIQPGTRYAVISFPILNHLLHLNTFPNSYFVLCN